MTNREYLMLAFILFLCVFSGCLYFNPDNDKKKNQLQRDIKDLMRRNDSLEEVNYTLVLVYDELEKENDSLKISIESRSKKIESLKSILNEINSHNYSDINNSEAIRTLSSIRYD